MAGDWMKVGLTTPDKPEIYLIADQLGIDPDSAFGKCFRVWAWFDQHTTNGHAPSVTNVTLKRVTGHADFVTAMINVGWLREEGDELIMVGFDRHNGESSKNRALAAERQRKSREKVTETSREKRDKSVTREEKRREENNIKNQEQALNAPSAVDKSKKRKAKFPHETLPDDWAAYAKDRRPDLNPQTTFENCRDYYLAEGKPMADWTRCWQRWVRNEKTGGKGYDFRSGDGGQNNLPRRDEELIPWAKRHGCREPRPGEDWITFRRVCEEHHRSITS